jgi:hypothetical protein
MATKPTWTRTGYGVWTNGKTTLKGQATDPNTNPKYMIPAKPTVNQPQVGEPLRLDPGTVTTQPTTQPVAQPQTPVTVTPQAPAVAKPKTAIIKGNGASRADMDVTYLNADQRNQINQMIAKGQGMNAAKTAAEWNKQAQARYSKQATAAPQTPVSQPETPAPALGKAPEVDPRMNDVLTQIFGNLSKSTPAFENNPDYVQGRERQMKELDNYLAAKGLSGSGYAVQARSDLEKQLKNQEQSRVDNWNHDNIQNQIGFFENDQNRAGADKQNSIGNILSAISLMLGMDPSATGYDATGQLASGTQNIANNNGQYTGNNYTVRSGGGGTSVTPPAPVKDTSGSSLGSIINGGNNQTSIGNLLSSLISYL